MRVSSEPLDDSPPLPPSALSASGSICLSSSGSLQTHLSSFNSEQRLRSLPSVTDDLEKQTGSDPDDSDGEAGEDNKQSVAKQRFWWLVRAFVWFSVLFFPISVLGDYGFLSRRPSANPLSRDYESGRNCHQKGQVTTKVTLRLPTFPLGKRAALVQDNHPRPSTLTIPLLYFCRFLQFARSYSMHLVQSCRLRP